jgi:hypothetical protein
MKRDPTLQDPAARLSDDELDAFYPACEPLDAACAGPRFTRLPPPCDEVGWLLLDLEPAAPGRD